MKRAQRMITRENGKTLQIPVPTSDSPSSASDSSSDSASSASSSATSSPSPESPYLNTLLDENDKKIQILRAATRLFAERGYAGTSVREIVEMAGVTKPTLYYYFTNKEDLYLKLMDLAMDTYARVLRESAAGPGGVRERLLLLFVTTFEVLRANVDFLRFANCAFYGPPGATPAYDLTVCNDLLDDTLLGLLGAGIAEGELVEANVKPAMVLLKGLMRLIEEAMAQDPVNPSVTPADIASSIDLIFDGPTKTPGEATA